VINGYGGETASGRITVDQYKFFTEGDIDINDLISDDEVTKNIPKPMMFIKNGAWYEMEDLFHSSGCELGEDSFLKIFDEDENKIWVSPLELNEMILNGFLEANFHLTEIVPNEISDVGYYYVGRSIEKGIFFDAYFETKDTFNIKKLELFITNYAGWELTDAVKYDGESIESYNYDTRGSSISHNIFSKFE
jgi:hypothetical protein